ncbi:MAG: hypothetical protein VR73_10595 [Gammaproteobacteria bacterium BRH_c0]|nr:MAG: hypothetical protein VR73_10595 [Gammaproteobacteria bacterium BRH_c0]
MIMPNNNRYLVWPLVMSQTARSFFITSKVLGFLRQLYQVADQQFLEVEGLVHIMIDRLYCPYAELAIKSRPDPLSSVTGLTA